MNTFPKIPGAGWLGFWALAAFLPHGSRAAVLFTDLSNAPLTLSSTSGLHLSFELGLDGAAQASIGAGDPLNAADAYDLNFLPAIAGFQITGSQLSALTVTAGIADRYPATALFAAGETIGGSTSFFSALTAAGPSGAWASPGTEGYIGLAPNSGANFGWALVSYTYDPAALDYNLTLYGFAVDTQAGDLLRAGQTATVPEPGGFPVVAGLAALLAALRRQRTAPAQKD